MRFLSRNTNAGPTASSNKVSDQHKTIAESGLFDADWYLTTYPDVAAAGLDPIDHYLNHGASEGRNPGPGFERSGISARTITFAPPASIRCSIISNTGAIRRRRRCP
jgi:hypothetical protein